MPGFDMAPVLRSVELLRESRVDHEFRTTVVRGLHDEASMEDMGRWLEGESKYFLQNFVDSGALIDPDMQGVEREDMRRYLEIVRKYIPTAELRGL